jgi:5-oxoprolinase (ATP-hydrolysing)
MSAGRWEFWIDRGGTFTDLVARAPDGTLKTLKLLSDDPGQYEDAAVAGIRRLLGLAPQEPISPRRVECVRMGTTVATNALLERRGERTLLLITRGFRDALRIATQARPRLFDLRIVLPELLYERVAEAQERIAASGEVVEPLDIAALDAELAAAAAAGIRACAIVFMHAYRAPAHELVAEARARAHGFTQVSVSHRVSPLIKLVPRGDTTVVDAYLSPILRRYVDRIAAQMPGVRLLFMQSSGGLTEAGRFQGKDAILSGPAGGIVGMVASARAAGHEKLIGFDMGGTSTDVSHFAGEYERAFDTEVGGVRVRAPMMSIHSIAAGGGSVIRFEQGRLQVGPRSAGAAPGPASYGRGGPLTITDANVLLGRLQPELFPRLFGARGDGMLDRAVVAREFQALALEMTRVSGRSVRSEEVAAGALEIAIGSMANAVKRISVARGHDVRRYTLQCFGGAGGQHACLLADALGMERIFCHPLAGVLCAYGMGLAEQIAMREGALQQPLSNGALIEAALLVSRLEQEARAALEAEGIEPARVRTIVRARVRYQGTDTVLDCPLPAQRSGWTPGHVRAQFERRYLSRFAFLMPHLELVLESLSVECIGTTRPAEAVRTAFASGPAAEALPGARNPEGTEAPAPRAMPLERPLYCLEPEGNGRGWRSALVFEREHLLAGAEIEGPALIVERHGTIVVEPGWRARVHAARHLELERARARAGARRDGAEADPILLEVFNNLFMSIAEQMGLTLQNTAHSVNIKERLDFSCALFDASGALIANAPHMPVHLGSMSESIRAVIARNVLAPGEVFVLNDPYHGGTHLPDVTVVTPVFMGEAQPSFFVASRGHHADIGGITPGSMPPFSTTIDEEGVLIDNFKLIEAGRMRESALEALLESGAHPARNSQQNLADLRAQVAANEKGVQELRAMVEEYGLQTVTRYMRHVQDNAEECVRRAITALHAGDFTLPLDNGAQIRVAVRVDAHARSATIDFSGTSAQLASNFNAPRSITVAAVLYVFRTLVADDIPLNAGCLKPLEIIIPEGSLLSPHPPAAVVAGNVETSMCVTNALYGALGVMASSQCTMNNFTFGNQRYQYYETIAGGSGAGSGFAGTSAVQTHMTNSRLTDPEVLEFRFPVRIESHEIRVGSGGAGRHRGGDGAIRRIRFLEPMSASILSNGRRVAPFGMAGGAPGAPGENRIERADGRREMLGATAQVEMAAGDLFIVATPGGGGFGRVGG